MKLTRNNVIHINHVLKTTEFDLPIKAKFRYMVTRNIKISDSEIDDINEAFPVPDSVMEYKEKEAKLLGEYGINSPGEASKFEEEKQQAFDGAFSTLKEENASVVDETSAYEKEKTEFLSEEIDIELKSIDVDLIPDIAEANQYPHWEIWSILEMLVAE